MSVSPSHQRRPQPLTELPTRDQRRSRLQNPTPATRSFVLLNEHRQTVESLQKPWNLPSSPPTNSAPSPTYRLSERNAYIIVLPPPTLPVRRTPAKIRLAPLPQPPSSLSSWGGWRIPSPSVPSGPPSPPCPCRLLLPLAVRPGHGLGRPSSPRPVSSLSQGQILSCRSPQWPCFQGKATCGPDCRMALGRPAVPRIQAVLLVFGHSLCNIVIMAVADPPVGFRGSQPSWLARRSLRVAGGSGTPMAVTSNHVEKII